MTNEEKSERIASLIERLNDDPELIEKVGDIIGAAASDTTASAEEVPSVATSVSAHQELFKEGQKDRRHHLLTALRPYLSDRRAKALDSFEAIADLLDYMKPE